MISSSEQRRKSSICWEVVDRIMQSNTCLPECQCTTQPRKTASFQADSGDGAKEWVASDTSSASIGSSRIWFSDKHTSYLCIPGYFEHGKVEPPAGRIQRSDQPVEKLATAWRERKTVLRWPKWCIWNCVCIQNLLMRGMLQGLARSRSRAGTRVVPRYPSGYSTRAVRFPIQNRANQQFATRLTQ